MTLSNIPFLFMLVLFSRLKLTWYYFFLKNQPKKLSEKIEKEKLLFAKRLLSIVGVSGNYNVEFLGTLPKLDNFILISNHRSFLDILIIEVLFSQLHNKHSVYIAKEELRTKFLFGRLLELFRVYFIVRGESKSSKEMMSFIKTTNDESNDIGFVIFPEGTRNLSAEEGIQSFEKGVDVISRKFKLPVLPIYISGFLESYYEKWDTTKQKEKVTVFVGDVLMADKETSIENRYAAFIDECKTI